MTERRIHRSMKRVGLFFLVLISLTALVLLYALTVLAPSGKKVVADKKSFWLVNLARVVEWPEERAGQAFIVGVVGDKDIAESMMAYDGQSLVGKRLVQVVAAETFERQEEFRDCSILLVGDANEYAVVSFVRMHPVLTVSFNSGFMLRGGVMQLAMEQGGMAYGINMHAADLNRLDFDPVFLRRAEQVDEVKD